MQYPGLPVAGIDVFFDELLQKMPITKRHPEPVVLSQYQPLYETNHDMFGNLKLYADEFITSSLKKERAE